MLHVYMTHCSLMRAYNQMTNARRSAVSAEGATGSVEWLDGSTETPRNFPGENITKDSEE